MSYKINLIKPDDWHIHLRDGMYLNTTVLHAAERFARVLVMPNLPIPVTDASAAMAYKERILNVLPAHLKFTPLMTLYLTDYTTKSIIREAKSSNIIYGCKLYPANATTHSKAGVSDIKKLYPIFETMEEVGIPLQLHGEITDPNIDIFDREKYFIEQHLLPVAQNFPKLKIVMEHITTREAVSVIEDSGVNVAATITAHHLLLNRNALFLGGINPHAYCLPVLKRQEHQNALIKAATSGNPKFFLGTDSAPHTQKTKECAHGCAGIYTSHAAIELYAEVFAEANALEKLEAFASLNGADFYGLARNKEMITLVQSAWEVPTFFKYGKDNLIPFRAGETVSWKIV